MVVVICGIAGNTKSVNNVAYKSFNVKSISVNKPSSVPIQYKHATYFYTNNKYVTGKIGIINGTAKTGN